MQVVFCLSVYPPLTLNILRFKTTGFKSCDGLVDYGYKEHHKAKHSTNEFANLLSENHIYFINVIENFGSLC